MIIVGVFENGGEVYTCSTKTEKRLTNKQAVDLILRDANMCWDELVDCLVISGGRDCGQIDLGELEQFYEEE